MSALSLSRSSSPEVAVIGGGVIGLAIARALAGAGLRVLVLERGVPGQEASRAAAGMLCPRLESDPSSALARLGIRSLELYPRFARELLEETGIDIDLRLDGVFASDIADVAPGVGRRVDAAEIARLEPALRLREAIFVEDEGSVDNRALVRALRRACELRGVRIERGEACEILTHAGRVVGLRTLEAALPVDLVVNAAGAWAGEIAIEGARVDVRPVKGQMLSLEPPPDARVRLGRTIYSHLAYVVPRSDGRVVVGTTVEDRGFDKSVDADAIETLRRAAITLVPDLESARVIESWAGLRPRGSSDVPALGPRGPDGYFVAVGHFRNGILLTPVTACEIEAAVLALIAHRPPAAST